MHGYWFNQKYGYLTNADIIKFNRRYVGIPFKHDFPLLNKQYTLTGTFKEIELNTPLLNKQYTFNGTFKEIQLNIPLLNKQYKFNGSFNTAERE